MWRKIIRRVMFAGLVGLFLFPAFARQYAIRHKAEWRAQHPDIPVQHQDADNGCPKAIAH